MDKDKGRQDFRLKYNRGSMASFSVDDADGEGRSRAYAVIDIGERGIRFRFDGGKVEDPVKGTITFCNGGSLKVEGEILRRTTSEICLKLKQIMPARKLLEEKKYLHRK